MRGEYFNCSDTTLLDCLHIHSDKQSHIPSFTSLLSHIALLLPIVLSSMPLPHPLSALSTVETNLARDIVKAAHPGALLYFRQSYLFEPPKEEVLKFLELEHSNALHAASPRPDRCAQVFYDIIGGESKTQYYESVVDLTKKTIVDQQVVSSEHQSSLTL